VNCHGPHWRCDVNVKQGFRYGFLIYLRQPARRAPGVNKPRRTMIQLSSSHMKLRALLKVARSFRQVSLDRPAVQLTSFLSSDRGVWCGIGLRSDDDRWCSTYAPHFGAFVSPDGTIGLCGDAQPADPQCVQNWDDHAPVLAAGQSSDVGGYVCTDQAGTVKSGPGAGKGFRVDRTGSSAVSPP
jgi:hypothetical protein